MATEDIGGWARSYVPKGTEGVVVEAGGWSARLRVAFTVPGGFWSADEVVTIDVDDFEVARI